MDRRDQGKGRGGGEEARDGRLHSDIPKVSADPSGWTQL
jgi:hypothetical protein